MLYLVIGLSLISLVFGYVLGKIDSKQKPVGDLVIDQSDDQPFLFLEFNTNSGGVEKLKSQSQVVLDVVVKNYITQ